MNIDTAITVDEVTPTLRAMIEALEPNEMNRAIGEKCAKLIQNHLLSLGPNKKDWPTTGFYAGVATATEAYGWDFDANGVTFFVDSAEHPGAMRQRFHGGPIR